MMRTSKLLPAIPLIFLTFLVPPLAGQGFGEVKKAEVEALADRSAYDPGATARLAFWVEIEPGWHVNSHTPSYDYLIPTELSLNLPPGSGEPSFEYPVHSLQKFEFTEEPIAVYDGRVRILAEFTLPPDLATGPVSVEASLRYQACDHQQCLPPTTAETKIELMVGPGGEPVNDGAFVALEAAPIGDEGLHTLDRSAASGPAAASAPSLGLVLLLALLGGLILNAMPCVLPVLSLKVFGLIKSGGLGRSHLVSGCLATTAGVLVSFWALAGAAVLAQAAGEAVGWGIQFQQPGFVTFLALIVILFSLNLWGVFEINLPTSVLQMGGEMHGREGLAGHFASGLFATLMATPCSAPFLGTAVGFALAQTPLMIFVIFTAIGLGLALPYLILAAFPKAGGLLPKPGGWMVTFKHVMGFLLAAAAVWLFYVLAAQVSAEYLAFIQLAILGLALFVWLYGSSEEAPGKRRAATVGALLAAVLAVGLAAAGPAPALAGGSENSAHFEWLSFDESEALRLSSEESRYVFVDVTADWCLTCKANERLVIETAEVAAAFEEHGVVTMKADWTNRDDRITAFLAQYGRSAVPFYVLYRPGREPHVFGELLTKGRLLGALESAG